MSELGSEPQEVSPQRIYNKACAPPQSTAANQGLLNGHLIGFRIRVQVKINANTDFHGGGQLVRSWCR